MNRDQMCTVWSRGVDVLFGLDCLTHIFSFNVRELSCMQR